MALGETLWILAAWLCILIPALLLAWAVYYDITRTHLPPGLKRGFLLRLGNFGANCTLGTGLILEKLGICNKFKICQLLLERMPPWKDPKLIIKDLAFEDMPVRMYYPKTPWAGLRRAMIYIHGGGGLIASHKVYERMCRHIARESNTVVLNVGYPLFPENPHPLPVERGIDAIIYFLKNAKDYGVDPDRISIGGDSSGGTSATGICQRLITRVDLPRFQSQILMYPCLQTVDFNLPSYQQNQSVPPLFRKRTVKLILTYARVEGKYVDAVLKGAHVPDDLRAKFRKWIRADLIPEEFKVRGYVPAVPAPFSEELYKKLKPVLDTMFCPLTAEDAIIRQLPETFLLTCEYDVLRDDGLLYKKRLEDNGVPVTWYHDKHGFHAICSLVGLGILEFPSTQNIMKALTTFLERQ